MYVSRNLSILFRLSKFFDITLFVVLFYNSFYFYKISSNVLTVIPNFNRIFYFDCLV